MKVKNKDVAITGSNRGIGWALAKEAARRSARLSLVVRKKESVTEAQMTELKELGSPKVEIFELDMLNANAIRNFSDTFFGRHTADILINNAGLLTGGLLENQEPEEIEKMIQVNISALTLLTRGFLKHFLKRGSGKIVNNASVMGEMWFPAATTYAASKAYVIAMTEALRQELKGTDITTVLMYTPGVKTDMFDDIYKLYGGHLDLKFLSSIPAEEWAKKVWNAIEDGETEVRPSGATGFGLTLSQYLPKLLETVVSSKFRR